MNLVNMVRKTYFVIPEALRRIEALCISVSILIVIQSSSEREHYVGVDNYFVVDVILNVKLT